MGVGVTLSRLEAPTLSVPSQRPERAPGGVLRTPSRRAGF